MRFRLLFILLVINLFSHAQSNRANIWHIGNLRFDFNSGYPEYTGTNAMNWTETTAIMCDEDGNLLFYSNGGTHSDMLAQNSSLVGGIWNRHNEMMPNGELLDNSGCVSAFRGAVAIPNPGNKHQYYLFTKDCVENNFSNGLRYALIDMTLDNGRGDVIEAGIELVPGEWTNTIGGDESILAMQHGNDEDYWILTTAGDSIAVLLVNDQGISLQHSLSYFKGNFYGSPSGDHILVSRTLYRFDKFTGLLSNPQELGLISSNADFSPNGRFLYCLSSNDTLLQFDTQASDVLSSKYILGPMSRHYPRLAPDGKIYFLPKFLGTQTHDIRGTISCPNLKGASCGYDNSISYFELNNVLLGFGVNTVPAYYYGEACAPPEPEIQWNVSPNPTSDKIIVSNYGSVESFLMTDSKGDIVHFPVEKLTNTMHIDMSALANGIYYLHLNGKVEKIVRVD